MDRFVARTDDLVVEELDGGLVIYDGQEAQAHYLDASASAVWRACRQPGTEGEIVGAAGIDSTEGETVLSQLIDLGLVEPEAGSAYSRRTVLRTAVKVGLGGAVAAPIISAVVPMAAAAQSVHTPPPGIQGPLTPGYWKNHQSSTTPLLPQTLGTYVVMTFAQAVAVFNNMNFGGTNAFNGLAGHLLATELNIKLNALNGTTTPVCATAAVTAANNLLTSVHYTGPSGTYHPTSAQRDLAVALANTLNSYNNGSATCS
jgi:hypothetical protein